MVEFTWLPADNGNVDSTAEGVMDESGNQWGTSTNNNTTNASNQISSTSACIYLCTNGGASALLTATFVSMDSDGFTINVSVAASQTVGYKAYR